MKSRYFVHSSKFSDGSTHVIINEKYFFIYAGEYLTLKIPICNMNIKSIEQYVLDGDWREVSIEELVLII